MTTVVAETTISESTTKNRMCTPWSIPHKYLLRTAFQARQKSIQDPKNMRAMKVTLRHEISSTLSLSNGINTQDSAHGGSRDATASNRGRA